MPINKYTKKELKEEQEANYFACALLMPLEMFKVELESRKHLVEEVKIKQLSDVFEVPEWAVVMRLQMYHHQLNNL
jgi:Zn-dependent peptidase ImmA (M78 family)